VFGLTLWSQPRTDPKSEVTQWTPTSLLTTHQRGPISFLGKET